MLRRDRVIATSRRWLALGFQRLRARFATVTRMRLAQALLCAALLRGGAAESYREDKGKPVHAPAPHKHSHRLKQKPQDKEGGHYITPGRNARVPLDRATYRCVYDLFRAFEAHGVPAALFFGEIDGYVVYVLGTRATATTATSDATSVATVSSHVLF